MQFKDNQKLTIIFINNMMDTTERREIRLTRVVDGRQAYNVKGRQRTKEYFLDIKPDMLILEGWAIPVSLDTDSRLFKANGCFNFETDKPDLVGKYLKAKNINGKFNQWDKLMYVRPYDDNRIYSPLYPTV